MECGSFQGEYVHIQQFLTDHARCCFACPARLFLHHTPPPPKAQVGASMLDKPHGHCHEKGVYENLLLPLG
jgi:hypothetical protein